MEDSNNAIDATTGETNAETNSAAALKQFLLEINLPKTISFCECVSNKSCANASAR